MADSDLLVIDDLSKSYNGKSKALDGINVTVGRGEFVSVIGCSGAGKSTFLRCINRLIDPTEGSIIFNGEDVTKMSKRQLRGVRRRISMIFQHYNLVYRASAIENVLQGRLGYKSSLAGALGLYSEEENWKPLIFWQKLVLQSLLISVPINFQVDRSSVLVSLAPWFRIPF